MKMIFPTLPLISQMITGAMLPPILQSYKLADFKFNANGNTTEVIDLNDIAVDTFFIRVRGTVTVGATAPVGPVSVGFGALVSKIILTVNDTDQVLNISPLSASVISAGDFRHTFETGADLGLATADYEAIIPIDMRQMNTNMPWATALDGRVPKRVTVKLEYGDVNSLFETANDAAVDASSVNVEFYHEGTKNSEQAKNIRTRELIEVVNRIDRAEPDFEAALITQQSPATNKNFVEFVRGVYIYGRRNGQIFDVVKPGSAIRVLKGQETWTHLPKKLFQMDMDKTFQGSLPMGAYYIPMYNNGNLQKALPRTHLKGDLRVLVDVLDDFPGETDIVCIPDIVRKLKL